MAATTATAAGLGTTIGVSAAQGAANKGGQHAADKAHRAGAKRGFGGKMEKGLGAMVCNEKLKEKGRQKEAAGLEEEQEADQEKQQEQASDQNQSQ
ncbi:hypothetical protein OE88DRAFT_1736139 [Heliocybe sulcata]|uniref:Uncharacterized protein n=1 Tax=Heliocybe sulcata TaxID=5364 RepID=A0A5C3N3F7_9AGAM|nr:hypothetical protein OE88DRAFT_1736139 [Heliocybe sulcata]